MCYDTLMRRKISEKQLVRDISRQGELVKEIRQPKRGWIRQMRELLGMTIKALAQQCRLDPSTIVRLEQSEQKHSITLNSLEKLADGLNCDVKYILVPREPIDQYLLRRAEIAARREIAKVTHTMGLEGQQPTEEQVEAQIQDLAAELLHKRSSTLWEEE